MKANETFVILVDVRSAHNVGSIFRTADAAGVSKIFLTGYTPVPRDRFGRERSDISKVALGAEKSVEWEQIKNPLIAIKKLREQYKQNKQDIQIVAVEQSKNSIDYKKFKTKLEQNQKQNQNQKQKKVSTAYIFGNETEGLPKNVLKASDCIIEIPMHGAKESLNVSVSVGVILFQSLS